MNSGYDIPINNVVPKHEKIQNFEEVNYWYSKLIEENYYLQNKANVIK